MKGILIGLLTLLSVVGVAAPKKIPGTKISKPSMEEKVYTSTSGTASLFSSGFRHELMTSLTRGSFVSGKECKNCDTGTIIDVSGSYLRSWKETLQYGVEARLLNLSKEASGTGKSATRFDILGIGAYNLSSDFKNSLYAKAGVGLYSVLKDDGSDYENKFGLFIGVGKRFEWLNNLTYTPELRLVKRGDIDFAIQIDVLNFSIYWN